MPSRQILRLFELLKTTAIGGLFFLLPLVVIGFLLGQLAQACYTAAKAIDKYLPFHSVYGYFALLALAIAALILLCFFSGLLAQRSIPRRFMSFVEKYLLMVFPRYSIVKDQLSGNIGGKWIQSNLRPILIECQPGFHRIGFEVEEGSTEWATVYFPGSPDPWAGQIAVVSRQKLHPVPCDFVTAITSMERLGRELQATIPLPLASKAPETNDF